MKSFSLNADEIEQVALVLHNEHEKHNSYLRGVTGAECSCSVCRSAEKFWDLYTSNKTKVHVG